CALQRRRERRRIDVSPALVEQHEKRVAVDLREQSLRLLRTSRVALASGMRQQSPRDVEGFAQALLVARDAVGDPALVLLADRKNSHCHGTRPYPETAPAQACGTAIGAAADRPSSELLAALDELRAR